ncbi:hypothetical protein E2C01_076144 [Portunus trituberculatus]|uniref:Uncharacterized protein n=1 Tax=Portunus trituberculatus TaxID=210409 RepID=A0A5B7IGR6_PORTR|nr:hypothetical protein [Portunus trituberculatus]
MLKLQTAAIWSLTARHSKQSTNHRAQFFLQKCPSQSLLSIVCVPADQHCFWKAVVMACLEILRVVVFNKEDADLTHAHPSNPRLFTWWDTSGHLAQRSRRAASRNRRVRALSSQATVPGAENLWADARP